jgi:Fe-S-cluster-containing hydrogenase component 2
MTIEGPGPWVVGRRPPEADVVLPFDTISRRHAQLRRNGDELVIEDLGSENGTRPGVRDAGEADAWKPGPRLGAGQRVAVKPGAWFFLHAIPVRFERVEDAPARTDPVEAPPAAPSERPPADIEIEIDSPDRGLEVEVVEVFDGPDRRGNGEPPAAPGSRPAGAVIRLGDGATPFDDDLETVVHEEVDACIGCHECMDACPLEDHRLVTIAGLNAYAQGIGNPSEVVERFVADCTQCHACVPVCPADLQRSRIVLFNKMKEDRAVDPGRPLPMHVGDVATTSDLTVRDLLQRFSTHALVAPLASDERLAFLSRLRLRKLAPGERILTEGTFPDAVWLVLDGRLEVGMATARSGFQRMVVHGPGDTVGDVAVLSDQPSDLTARAVETTRVAGMSKFLLLHHASRSPAFRAALEARYADRATVLDARRWPEFQGLPPGAMDDLRRTMALARFAPEETVLPAKRQEREFVLVQRGFVREVRRDPRAPESRRSTTSLRRVDAPDGTDPELVFANYVGAGEAFGGGDSGRRGTAVRFVASTTVEVLRADVDDLRALDARHPGAGFLYRLRRIVDRRRDNGRAVPRGAGDGELASSTMVEDAESKGLLHGQRILLIDTRLCVDCDNCVSACERRHGWARLDRVGSGTQVGPFQVPASCFHCDDPLCLLCAEEAIVRLPGGEIQVQTDRCIGCGACAERCPYGNIEMVPAAPPRRSFLQHWVPDPILRWLGQLEAANADDGPRVAVKCDLCVGFADGPACVRACPVGAARRDDPRAVFLGGVEGPR